MTLSLKHSFVSSKSDSADPTKVNPSNWNAEHQLTVASNTIVGRADSGVGAATDLTPLQARTVINVDQAGTFSGANTKSDVSYTLVDSDRGKIVIMSSSSANTLTIPSNASVAFPIGTVIGVLQDGTGQTTVAINTDTLSSIGSKRKLRVQYSFALLLKVSTTRWILTGDIAS